MTQTTHAGMRLAVKTSLRFLLGARWFSWRIMAVFRRLPLLPRGRYGGESLPGKPVKLLEVDYPSASFGTGQLEPGAAYPYQMQFRNSGPLKVTYTANDGHQVSIDGPQVAEKQEGRLKVVLLPDGKAEFHPQLTPARIHA